MGLEGEDVGVVEGAHSLGLGQEHFLDHRALLLESGGGGGGAGGDKNGSGRLVDAWEVARSGETLTTSMILMATSLPVKGQRPLITRLLQPEPRLSSTS